MNTQCPKCQQQAMNAMGKVMTRPHVCQHCGTEVRMNLVYTLLASLAYFYALVRIALGEEGFSGGIAYLLLATLIFIGVCLFIPFEEKPARSS